MWIPLNEDVSGPTTIGTVSASDPDGDTLTYSADWLLWECNSWECVYSSGNHWEQQLGSIEPFTVNSSSGEITLTGMLDHEQSSAYSFTIYVSDGELSTVADVYVGVSDVDEAPVVSNPGDKNSAEGEMIEPLQIDAFDEDHPQSHGLTYSASGLPEGLSIGTHSGVISGKIAYDAAETNGGTYNVEITVTDPDGLEGTTSFTWTVTNAAIGTLTGTEQENGADTTNSITVAGTSSNAISVLQGNELALTLTPGAEGTLPSGGDIRYRADAIGAVTQTGTFATTPLIMPMSGELTTILVGIDLNGDGILHQETEVTHSFSVNTTDIRFDDVVGVAWEGGLLDFAIKVTSVGSDLTRLDIDVDRDGTTDASSTDYNEDTGTFLILDADVIDLVGSPAGEDGTYTATATATLANGQTKSQDFSITVGKVLPIISVDFSTDPIFSGQAFSPTITVTETGPDTISLVTVEWGDGFSDSFTSSPGTVSHTYTSDADYVMTVSATSEDGTSTETRQVLIGDVGEPPADYRPVIREAELVSIDPENNSATVTVYVEDYDGLPITNPNAIEWDLDLNGEFDDGTVGFTANVPYDSDSFYGWSFAIRVTNLAGEVNEAIFGFVVAGTQAPTGPTVRTARENFKKLTPGFDDTWEVHHILQVGRHESASGVENILADRFRDEMGINVNKPKYLRGVHKVHHYELNALQRLYWGQLREEMEDTYGFPVTKEFAMKNCNLSDYKEWAEAISEDPRYTSKWIKHGTDSWLFPTRTRRIAKTNDYFKNDLAHWVKGKGTWFQGKGIILSSVVYLTLFYDSACACASMANNSDTALAKWDAFESLYHQGLAELRGPHGKLTQNTAHHINAAWKDYCLSTNLDSEAVEKIHTVIGAYIDNEATTDP